MTKNFSGKKTIVHDATAADVARAGTFLSQGRGADALAILAALPAAARAKPDVAHMIGIANLQKGDFVSGIEALKRALMLAPGSAEILDHLGVALCQIGQRAEGLNYLKRAVAIAPNKGGIRNNLGHAFNEMGRYAEAAIEYAAVVRLAPDMPPVWQGYASALHKSGDNDAALRAIDEAITRFPGNSAFHASRGRILIDLDRAADAEAAFKAALSHDPANADAANNLGTLIEEKGRHGEAIALYHVAARARPGLADAWFNLGNAYEKSGDLVNALPALRQAAGLRPDNAKLLASVIGVRRKLCDWNGLDEQVARLRALVQSADFASSEEAPAPFGMLSLMVSADEQLRVARHHSTVMERKAAKWRNRVEPFGEAKKAAHPLPEKMNKDRKIRVGYLSPDFREHPIAQLIAGVFEMHDRNRFEISAWSLGPDDQSTFRRRIEAAVDRFEDIRDLDVPASVDLVRKADLDILVDLAGYTAHSRPELLALRAAPVQVNYLGYPGSMGASFMDYIIADPIVLPPGDERFYSEKVIRLPTCYQANDDRVVIDPDPVTRAEFGLPEDRFVFACFSMNYKIDNHVLDAWAAILKAVPQSVLWLFRTDKAAADNIHREAEARGIANERIVFADRLPKARHLARHRLADLFLDTFAYGAHTTASDALWAGLPVLTLLGDTFARRVGASIVNAAGMPELIAQTTGDYIARAIDIGKDPQETLRLKKKLMENRNHCALFSTAGIARDLEAAYLEMAAAKAGMQG